MPRIQASLSVAILFAAGCVHDYTFTKSTTQTLTGKPPTCEFTVTATVPADYEEIGILESAGEPAPTLAFFKKGVAEKVCAAGGEVVVGQIDQFGNYRRAAVFVKKK